MQKNNQDELLKAYDRLPEPVKEAMYAEATAEKMQSIGRKHGLMLDAVGKLAEETGYVMIGATHPRDFPRELANTLAVPPSKAREIAEDVNQQVFKPIREHLMKMFNIEDIPSGPMPAPAVSAAPKPSFAPTPKPPPVASFNPTARPEAVNLGTSHGNTPEVKAPPMIFPGRINPSEIKTEEIKTDTSLDIPPTIMPQTPLAHDPIPPAPHFETKPISTPPPNLPLESTETAPPPPPASTAAQSTPPTKPPATPQKTNDPYHEPIE